MPVTLDTERIWTVTCDHPDCRRRYPAQAPTAEDAAAAAVQRVAWVLRDGGVWCPFHGRVSRRQVRREHSRG